MRVLSLIVVILAAACQSTPYGSHPEYTGSSSYTSSSSSSTRSSNSVRNCCQLNAWGLSHDDEVRLFANRLRQDFNNLSRGGGASYTNPSWNTNIIQLTGKTHAELDDIQRQICEQLVSDMRKGLISYATIAQPNFFEWKAAEVLQSFSHSGLESGQQQALDVGQFQQMDLSNFDEVKNFAYPAEVKVIDGKTYVVHRNCTEASKTTGEGTFGNPLVTRVNRNRTVITSNSLPTMNVHGGGITTGSMVTGGAQSMYPSMYVRPGGSTTTTTVVTSNSNRNYRDWFKEPSVVAYSPVVSVNNAEWMSGNMNMNSYKPPVHIPVDTTDVETFHTSGSHLYRPSFTQPGSTVTIHRYNKTTYTNSDGTSTVRGSEINKKWVDGKLVVDTERPFGEWTVPRDEAWKREERERFFWFLPWDGSSTQSLEDWERQHEDRLLALAQRYQISIEEIHEWHRKELERYRLLLGQYRAQENDLMTWQRMERGRLDWLIHQNSLTRAEFDRWQRENHDKLLQLARSYNLTFDALRNWQVEELNRLYKYFNDQNNSMIESSSQVSNTEQERLEELIRQHNATIEQLHNSIKLDQQKLFELSQKYRGNIQDMEKWLKTELARLGGIIEQQQVEMTRITEWQRSERQRLEDIVRQHRGSIQELEVAMARDRTYITSLAAKYHVSIEELEKWQRAELERLHTQSQLDMEMNIKEWQRLEREHLKSIITKNDLTIEEFQTKIMSDRARLESLANTYKVQVSEVEEWIKNEIKNFHSQGLLKEVEKELAIWQKQERDRLLAIVQQNDITVEELETKIKNDQTHLYTLANTYQVRVEEIEEWLKKELLRLQGQGLIKVEDLEEWQKREREEILKIVQQNKLTIEEFETKLLADRRRLMDLSKTYNIQINDLESWIKKEGERLQNMGLLKIREELNNWQRIERERLLTLINQNNLSIDELEEKIKKDQTHLYSLAHQHQVHVEEIEAWIKQEIKRLQQEGLIEMEKLKDWQTEWRGNLTNMVRERDFTVEEFHKWLLEDRARLNALAMQHNVQIEEIEQWVRNEEQRFIAMGLLKPNEKLTNWQEIERRYLERITQQQYHSTEQLEMRLRQDRQLLEKLARDYSVQVEEIESWMKKELARLRDEGQLQIENLTAWQIAERARLEELIKMNKQWSVEEFEAVLRKDREHMQTMAFQYHTSVEEIEKWIVTEVERLRQQGKLNIEELTAWQKKENERIMNLLRMQSSITVEEFERKVAQDRQFLINLANQYHISVIEVEAYVKKVIEDLRKKGSFEVENLQTWQLVERDYIKQLLAQHNNALSTHEFEQKLRADRAHLKQLSDQYRINIDKIEKWMIEELQRLRSGSEQQVQQLAAWQVAEAQRLRDLLKHNNHLTYVQFEVELMKERQRLQDLARQYSLSVEEIEQWLRQQLLNLKTNGQVQVESLTLWQESEQKRLIELLLQQQNNISYEEFEMQLRRDRARLQELSQKYHVSIEQIERWMRDELTRLKNSGLIQVEQLTYWQQLERKRLEDWLKARHNGVSHEEFIEFLRRDNERLQQLAQEYSITVEEVESWVNQEGVRLQLLGKVTRPTTTEWEFVFNTTSTNANNNIWKEHTRNHLQTIAAVKHMNWADFERYLVEWRPRLEQVATTYHITVEEIETWLRQSAHELVKQGVISGTVTVEEWQLNEQSRINQMINELLRNREKWTVEELKRQLEQDRTHMQQLIHQYQISMEQLQAWYTQELQRLLNQQKITSESLIDWQRLERERIYQAATSLPNRTLQVLEQQFLSRPEVLRHNAFQYKITIEELEFFIRKELRRLVVLGVITDTQSNSDYRNWHQLERKRLHTIATEISITDDEFVDFIAADYAFQAQLASEYGCGLEELAPFQRTVLLALNREAVLDQTRLIKLQPWQKLERDRLYKLIKNQNFTLKDLRSWQKQDSLSEVAAKYGISAQSLKDWQLHEFERLMQLAVHYRLNLYQLQDFRDKELQYLTYIMHKKFSTESERVAWGTSELRRMAALTQLTGYSGEELLVWRRRLYLLCQGYLPFDWGTNDSGTGGGIIDAGNSDRTALPVHNISKDRGDQPPNIYEESGEGSEPGLGGLATPSANIKELPSTQRPPVWPSNVPGNGGQGGYRYRKQEYTFTVPVGQASASAVVNMDGAAASASAGVQPNPYRGMQARSVGMGNQQEQQQQREVEDLGQQQQVELNWNANLNAHDGGQQQQQQEEDFHYSASNGSSSGSSSSSSSSTSSTSGLYRQTAGRAHAQQQEENFGQQQQQIEDSRLSGVSGHYISGAHSQQQVEDFGQQQQVEDFGQQQQVELGDYRQHDFGQQQQVQLGDLTQQDFGQQQQIELGDFKQQDLGQQQQVEDYHGTLLSSQHGSSQKQVAVTNTEEKPQVEVIAEQEPSGFWGKVKKKTSDLFG